MTETAIAVAELAARVRAAGVPIGTAQVVDSARALTLLDASETGAAPAALVAILAASADEAAVVRPIVERWLAGRLASDALDLGLVLPEAVPPSDAEAEAGTELPDASTETEATPGSTDPEAGAGDDAPAPGDGMRGDGADEAGADGEDEDAVDPPAASPWSAVEILRHRRFDAYAGDDLDHAAVYLASIPPLLPRRQLRRLRAAPRGSTLDLRRTLTASVRLQGEPLVRAYRDRTTAPRRVVLLVDVSGSMERWTRPLLLFLHAAVRSSRSVEALAFGTRLTRLTRALDVRDPSVALARATDAVPDWSGGTLIGENLEAFNRLFGRRGATREAAVVIVSDGWERGDATRLRGAMAELRRSAHSIVWVNPLAGTEGYRPLVAGLVAALDYVDVFLPGHDLAAIDSLVEILRALPEHRPSRIPASSGAGGRVRASRSSSML